MALVPVLLVTRTSTVPAACAGVTAWINVSASTLMLCAGVPKVTAETVLQKPEPVMNTDVPPAVVPEIGETPVTVATHAIAVTTKRSKEASWRSYKRSYEDAGHS